MGEILHFPVGILAIPVEFFVSFSYVSQVTQLASPQNPQTSTNSPYTSHRTLGFNCECGRSFPTKMGLSAHKGNSATRVIAVDLGLASSSLGLKD